MSLILGRRALLQAGLGSVAATSLQSLAFGSTLQQQNAGLLVVVYLRGGMDGLHFLSPGDDARFADMRVAELRTAAEGGQAGHRLEAVRDTDFRLHREAEGIARIWRDGRMAIWPAAGLPEATRSHFEAQAMMGLGQGRRSDRSGGRGWLATWSEATSPNRAEASGSQALAVAGQGALPLELLGAPRAAAVPTLENGLEPPHGSFGETVLRVLYRPGRGIVEVAGLQALDIMRGIDAMLPRTGRGRVQPYRASNGADYGPAGSFGRGLSVVAQVAKSSTACVAGAVDLGGWDHHDGQAARMVDRLRVLDAGLTAFDADMQDVPRRWTVVVLSEFGRRLRANRSGGTDHGRAGVMFAFGGPSFGLRRHFGPWPGLAPDALEEGVDLRVATDYREAIRRVVSDLGFSRAPFASG